MAFLRIGSALAIPFQRAAMARKGVSVGFVAAVSQLRLRVSCRIIRASTCPRV